MIIIYLSSFYKLSWLIIKTLTHNFIFSFLCKKSIRSFQTAINKNWHFSDQKSQCVSASFIIFINHSSIVAIAWSFHLCEHNNFASSSRIKKHFYDFFPVVCPSDPKEKHLILIAYSVLKFSEMCVFESRIFEFFQVSIKYDKMSHIVCLLF